MAALVLLLCSLATSLLILTLKSRALNEAQQRLQGRPQRRRAPSARIAQSPAGGAARLQVCGGLLLLGGHLMAMLLRTDRSRLAEPAGLAGEAAVPLVLGLLLVALPGLRPATFERHRTLLVGAARVAVFMASDVRNPRGLLFIFQRPPAPGILRDTWQLLLGSRVVAIFCTAVACPLPLIPHLLVSAFALQRCRVADYICSCPLLQHPVWRRRIAAVHSSIHKLPLLVPDRGPLACAAQGPAGPSGFPLEGVPALDCRVFLTFVMLLGGLVAPTLLMARVQGPQCWAAAGTADEADEAGTAGGASQGPRRTADSGGSGADGSGSRGSSDADTGGDGSMRQGRSNKRCGARLCAAARAAISAAACCLRWAACEAGSILHHLCELLLGASGGVLAAAAWWMLVSLLWVTALLLEGASPGAADAT